MRDRGEAACALLWSRVPPEYKTGRAFNNFVGRLPGGDLQRADRATGKGKGQACHVEWFNNTLRQRFARFVRKTLSFSNND